MNKKADLSFIKENKLNKTSSFTDLMSKKEKKEYKKDDIEEMIEEKRKNTSDLEKELNKAKKIYNRTINDDEKIEEKNGKTQILELTRQIKFNIEEKKDDINKSKSKIISPLNIIGEVNLLCICYYIYLLIFTSFQEKQNMYLITGFIIVLLVLLFGLSVITKNKISKFFNILNILIIICFIVFNIYTFIK